MNNTYYNIEVGTHFFFLEFIFIVKNNIKHY